MNHLWQRIAFTFLVVVVVVPLACAPVVKASGGSIDLTKAGHGFTGLSLAGGNFHLVNADGISEVDRQGKLLQTHKMGDAGLLTGNYGDLAVVDAGADQPPQYILIADDEGYLYDPATQNQSVRFCLVLPVGPSLQQKNGAVAVTGDTILSSPRFYDDNNVLQSSSLRTYALEDGTQKSSVDLEDRAELEGVAVTKDGVVGVENTQLHRYTSDGKKSADDVTLDGVTRAAGVAVDGDSVFVLDDDVIRVFSLRALSGP